MTTLETLKAAKAKISDPKNWIQGRLVASEGEWVPDVQDPRATQWCSIGAILAVGGTNLDCRLLDRISLEVRDDGDARPAAKFNDTHTHAEVLALFDKAIASLETAVSQ